MLTIRSLKNGSGYADRHLAYPDYLDESARVTGSWFGKGAAQLSLSGAVLKEAFENLRVGLHPTTQRKLRQRINGSDNQRTLYDCVFSSPKSVSVQALLGGDSRLIRAHDLAVTEALTELEKFAQTRVRVGGQSNDRDTGNLIVAVYRHHAGRKLQPQLHSHAVVLNLTFDPTERRWKALQARGIYDAATFLTEVYRASLARQVLELGYQVERTRDRKGRHLGWELGCVSPVLRAAFSETDRKQEAIAEFIAREGRTPSNNEVAVLIRGLRDSKLASISTAEVQRLQRERISPGDYERLLRETKDAMTRGSVLERGSAPESFQCAKDHMFERVSVVRDYELLAETLRHGLGRVSIAEARTSLNVAVAMGDVLERRWRVATRGGLEEEATMIRAVNKGSGRYERLGLSQAVTLDPRLSEEQRRAVGFLKASRDLAVCMEGAAGTGKTFTLQEFQRVLLLAGRPVRAIAPTRAAVKELERVGFNEATTIEALLRNPTAQAALRGHAVIVDEAGMVSNGDMRRLLAAASENNFRLVLVGDPQQIRSVQAGDALRVLLAESRLEKTSLLQVRRQQEQAMDCNYRPIIQLLRTDPARAFARLENLQAVEVVDYIDRPDRTAALVLDEKRRAGKRERSVLVVCPTHHEIARYNEAIRARLKSAGQLGAAEQTLERLEPLNWTLAQKREPVNFAAGHVLVFHNDVKDAAVGDRFTVARVDRTKIFAVNKNGDEVCFTKKQAHSFSVFSANPIEIAGGEQILLQANRKLDDGHELTNGDVAVVKKVDRQGRIHLEDGRLIPSDFGQFTYGYASTAHRSQGSTVDSVVVAADKMERELFYVACSRGRERVHVLTSDVDLLRESVTWGTARQSATELVRETENPASSVWSRAVEWARKQARSWQKRFFGLEEREHGLPFPQLVHAIGGHRSAVGLSR